MHPVPLAQNKVDKRINNVGWVIGLEESIPWIECVLQVLRKLDTIPFDKMIIVIRKTLTTMQVILEYDDINYPSNLHIQLDYIEGSYTKPFDKSKNLLIF